MGDVRRIDKGLKLQGSHRVGAVFGVVAGLLKEPLDEAIAKRKPPGQRECGGAVVNLAYLCDD